MASELGIYISVPFCRAKCSFCNFASGVFAAERMEGYISGLLEEVRSAPAWATAQCAELPRQVDSIYLGGGTPSLLEPRQVARLFAGLRAEFDVLPDAEITVECAPGQLSDGTLAGMLEAGVNRLSFGVQSFVDAECAAVGRTHTGAQCRAELDRVKRAGVQRIGVDLIVGLPHQTERSWRSTIDQAIDSGVEHVSLYMLEVDEDSRLGREAIAGGVRYGAAALPHDDRVADWYAAGCSWLEAGGVRQYEISNFARQGGESRHNRKYWQRAPYLGFGLDAHSMLKTETGYVRWANAAEMGVTGRTVESFGSTEEFEESLFLGLRMVEGVDLGGLNPQLVGEVTRAVDEIAEAGLLLREGSRIRLTPRGRMVSNEVFERLLVPAA